MTRYVNSLNLDFINQEPRRFVYQPGVDVTWLVLPYKAAWVASGLPRKLRELICKFSDRQLHVRVCWKLGSPHLCNVLKKASSTDRNR